MGFYQPDARDDKSPVGFAVSAVIAWAARADELAAWAWERLVVRRDCWGAYTPPDRRGQTYTRKDGKPDKVPTSYTAKGDLTLALLAKHFRGARPEHVMGLHSTSPMNTSLAARVDIDCHGPGANDPACNLKAVVSWYDRLAGLGFRPLLCGSNGKGGYHLNSLFSEPVPTARVFAFLKWLTDDHVLYGLPVRPEVFPKQACIPEGGYGNWLQNHRPPPHPGVLARGVGRLPLAGRRGGRHARPRLGRRPARVDPIRGTSARAPEVRVTVRFVPAQPPRHGGSLESRIRAYMSRLPNRGEGQGRDDVGYSFACWLLRDLGLSDDAALRWLEQWDQGNSPPKGTERLHQIMLSARRYGQHAIAHVEGGVS